MKKNLIKIICLGVVLIMCVSVLVACNNNNNSNNNGNGDDYNDDNGEVLNDDDFRNPRNGEPEAGKFCSLQKAYDNGWISKGDLRNIAYHRSGDGQRKGFIPTPKTPETLSAETELAIKEARARDLRKRFPDAVADEVTVQRYYGTYDGLVALHIYDIYYMFLDAIWKENIGGIEFIYGNSNTIILWKSID